MFGYVKVYKPELKMREWEQYRGVYCSLCRTLGKRYGVFSRFLLSYDLTLLALYRMAIAKECPGFSAGHCTFNPAKKCMICHAEEPLAFAADATVLLAYYKLQDDRTDGGWTKRMRARVLLLLLAPMKRRAEKNAPTLTEKAAAYATAQSTAERAASSLDAAADPTAAFLAFLTADAQNDASARFGYCLGRWIYLMDAADDFDDDRRTGGFNPFLSDDREYMRNVLNACLSECLAAYHLVDRYRFDEILQNILQLGMPAEQNRVLTNKEKDVS